MYVCMFVANTIIFSAMTGSVSLSPFFAMITFRMVPTSASYVLHYMAIFFFKKSYYYINTAWGLAKTQTKLKSSISIKLYIYY